MIVWYDINYIDYIQHILFPFEILVYMMLFASCFSSRLFCVWLGFVGLCWSFVGASNQNIKKKKNKGENEHLKYRTRCTVAL